MSLCLLLCMLLLLAPHCEPAGYRKNVAESVKLVTSNEKVGRSMPKTGHTNLDEASLDKKLLRKGVGVGSKHGEIHAVGTEGIASNSEKKELRNLNFDIESEVEVEHHLHDHELHELPRNLGDLCTLRDAFVGEWVFYQPYQHQQPKHLKPSSFGARSNTHRGGGSTDGLSSGVRSEGGAYSHCPRTMKKLENTSLFDQIEKFSCVGRPRLHAHFKPKSCHLLSLKFSMQYFYKHLRKSKLLFVGDSLMGQQYISAMCHSELNKVELSYEQLGYIHDIFLRDDIPCHDNCTADRKYLEYYDQTFFNPCWSCRDGIRKNFSSFLNRSDAWVHNISGNVDYIMIGTGAWYNVFKGIMNSTESYIETLQMVGSYIGPRYTRKDKMTFWLDLPPVVLTNNSDYGKNKSKVDSFEWLQYADKNEMARSMLAPFGISYLDSGTATRARKVADANLTADGVHWCNPGADAVPTFINQVMFHAMVLNHISKHGPSGRKKQ